MEAEPRFGLFGAFWALRGLWGFIRLGVLGGLEVWGFRVYGGLEVWWFRVYGGL